MNYGIKNAKSTLIIKSDLDTPNLLLNVIIYRSDNRQVGSIILTRSNARILVDRINEWLNS